MRNNGDLSMLDCLIGRCERCGEIIRYKDAFCPRCGQPNDTWREVGEDQCGNCHAYLQKDDKYCRICGTKVGDGDYLPYQDIMQCVYGPEPIKRNHACKNCGFQWSTCLMVDREEFCPKCGSHAGPEGENVFDGYRLLPREEIL